MSKADYQVARQKVGSIYPKGCSQFVCEVLGVAYKQTSGWTQGEAVDKSDLAAGDVVGWKEQPGHVAIFDGSQFIYVPGCNQAVKISSTLGRQLYRMKY
jgi:cell wall-associated NlpC family hydrolase